MRFETPAWLALLAIIPLLAIVFVAGERRAAQNLKRFAATRLLPMLNLSARWPRILRFFLSITAVGLIVCSLARPSYGYSYREIHGKGADILFAIDVSRSMLCSDVTPDRLTRAKMTVTDMLEAVSGHRTGIIPFSGLAFLQCPLTLDATAVQQSLEATNATSIPGSGTSLAGPIAEARKAFGKGEGKKILVILTDGEDLEGSGLKEARASEGMTIITIGVGTAQGAPVRESAETGSGYTRDRYGSLVTSRLDSSSLEAIASATGGFYESASSLTLSMRLKALLEAAEGPENKEAANVRMPIIRYRWPLALALILIVAEALIPSARRKSAARLLAIALALMLPVSPNSADAAETIVPEPMQATAKAETTVPQGNPRETYNHGVQLYKEKKYAEAAKTFSTAAAQNAGKQDLLQQQILGNAGMSNLAQALQVIPEQEDEEMSPEADALARKYLNEAKTDLEKALSINPEDKILRRNFKRVTDSIEGLEKHKPKPKENKAEDKKEDNTIPPPKEDKPEQEKDKQDQKQDDQKQKDGQDQQQGQSGQNGQSGDKGQDKKDQQNQSGDQNQSGQQKDSGQNQQQQDQNSQSQSGQQDQQQQQDQSKEQDKQNPSQQSGQSGKEDEKQDQNKDSGSQQPQPQDKPSSDKQNADAQDKGDQQKPDDKQKQQSPAPAQGGSDDQKKDAEKEPQPSSASQGQQPDKPKDDEKKSDKASASTGDQQDKKKPEEQSKQQQDAQGGKDSAEKKDDAAKPAPSTNNAEGQDQQKQDTPSQSSNKDEDQNAGDTEHKGAKSESTAETPRREGEDTKQLARPDKASEANPDAQEAATPSGTTLAQTGTNGTKQMSMTTEEAERLLKIVEKDEKVLPAGKLTDKTDNNFTGKDW